MRPVRPSRTTFEAEYSMLRWVSIAPFGMPVVPEV